MPISSGLNQQLTQQFETLKTTIQKIAESRCFEPEHDNFVTSLEYLKDISKLQQAILMTQIALMRDQQPRKQNELDAILNTEINFPCVASLDGAGHSAPTMRYVIDTLMPKSIALMHLNRLIRPTEEKLAQLTERSEHDDNYREAHKIAAQIVQASTDARAVLYHSDNSKEGLKNGLKNMEQCIHAVYTDANINTLATHRGNSSVNTVLNLLRQLAGYAVWVVTLPLRLYDNDRTQAYVNSWLEKRQTDSLQIFGTFKRQATPKTYCCPITTKMMQEPVSNPEEPEFSFDKHAISTWLKNSKTNPLTKQYMDENYLFPNADLQKQIDLFHVHSYDTQQALSARKIYSLGV